jgi:hypothetical protein
MTAMHLYAASKGADQVHVHTADSDIALPRNEIVPLVIRMETVAKAHTMMAINLPGIFLQALISLPARTSPPTTWHPQALLLDTWRALVFPFLCLPFWWLVGCGMDVIVHNERLHWPLLLTGTAFFALLLVATFVFYFPMPASDRADLLWLMKGLIGWTIAFAVLPIAWITQSIRQRRERAVGSA